jgi:hypothetical protein
MEGYERYGNPPAKPEGCRLDERPIYFFFGFPPQLHGGFGFGFWAGCGLHTVMVLPPFVGYWVQIRGLPTAISPFSLRIFTENNNFDNGFSLE